MQEPRFLVESKIEKEDLNRFLFDAVFGRDKFWMGVSAVNAFLLCVLMYWKNFELAKFIALYILLIIYLLSVELIWVTQKNKWRMFADKSGQVGAIHRYQFYEDRLVMENEAGELLFEQSYESLKSLLESKRYLIFYVTKKEAAMIRKKDVEEIDALKEFLASVMAKKYKKVSDR